LLAAQLRRRAASLPRDGGARVDDRRRGRGAGPGQARLRARQGGPRDRPAGQPAVRRRAADRQARAHRDGDRRRRGERLIGGDRPLLLIDIAVPRDIDAACADIDGVTLYDIDDLQAVVARNLEVREAEAARAEGIVEDEIQRFARWMGQADVRPTVAALRRHGEEIVEQVLAENAGRWDAASPRDVARVEAMARAIMQRLLHE